MVNPLKYMLENPTINPNPFDILLKSRLFSYCKVAAGGLVVAGFAKLASYREANGSGYGMFKVGEWFKGVRGKGSEEN
ncbi:hypothetical protein SOVF_093570 [Spinacia oleracea]|nr:hypothetical protein SOVF_093570 [Spinacia oleracea]